MSPRIKYGASSAELVPVKTGSRELINELDSRFHGKPWIPHQVRNDRKVTL
jgi:hypothetical protein